jgi:hypothetical protein
VSDHPQWGFRERLELWGALLLAAATVATAYSAYQSTRWSGKQSTLFTSAGASRTESAKARSDAASLLTIDASQFTDFAVAYVDEDTRRVRALRSFFRDEFEPAFEEWVGMDPLTNPDAPATPFELDSYRPQRLVDSERLEDEASAQFEEGREANQTSDNYVLATIFFAAVLFFAGIATKFTSDRVVAFTLGAGTFVFLGGVMRLFTLPFL